MRNFPIRGLCYMIITFVCLLVGGYLVGSIPFGVIIARVFFNKDIMKLGSGNIGAKNVTRECGAFAGNITLLLDGLKGYIPVTISVHLGFPIYLSILVALCCLLGHVRSIFLGFRGGKAVSTALGTLIGLNGTVAGVCFLVFVIGYCFSGILAFGSVLAAYCSPFIIAFITHDIFMITLGFALAIGVPKLHKSNLHRIHADEEIPDFFWRKWLAGIITRTQMRTGKHCIFLTHAVGKPGKGSQKACRSRMLLGYLVSRSFAIKLVDIAPKWFAFMGVSQGIITSTDMPLNTWVVGVKYYTKELADPQNVRYKVACDTLQNMIEFAAESLLPEYVDRSKVVVGLGAANGIANRSGDTTLKWMRSHGHTMKLTNGNNYTAPQGVAMLLKLHEHFNIGRGVIYDSPYVAVIGAKGSVGSKCCELLLRKVDQLYIVGRPGTDSEKGMEIFRDNLLKVYPNKIIRIVTREEAYANADLVITTTNEEEPAALPVSLFNPGQLIVDLGEPANISVALSRQRPDILVVKGGLMRAPHTNFCWGFGRMLGLKGPLCFACCAETQILSMGTALMWKEGTPDNAYVGKSNLEIMDDLVREGQRYGFTLASYHNVDCKRYTKSDITSFIRARNKALKERSS